MHPRVLAVERRWFKARDLATDWRVACQETRVTRSF
jgi:hypothetical protein